MGNEKKNNNNYNGLSKEVIKKILGKEKPESLEEHQKLVEHMMGMTVDKFHEKMEELLTTKYLEVAEEFWQFFKDWIEQGNPIYTLYKKNQRELILQEGEYFVPCFHPDKPVRNELPRFWFYSNYDNLASVQYYTKRDTKEIIMKKVIWLPPKDNGTGRGFQQWIHPITGKGRSIKHYNLGAMIFNEKNIIGLAKVRLEQFGSYAYGVTDDPWNVNGHHEDSVANNPARIYDHEDVCTEDGLLHDFLRETRSVHEEIRKSDSPEEKIRMTIDHMEKFANIMEVEEPVRGMMLISGDRKNLDGTFIDNKGEFAYRYLADEENEWNITIMSLPGNADAAKWIQKHIAENRDRICETLSQSLKHLPYDTSMMVKYNINDAHLCNLLVTHMRPATA